MSRLVVLLLLLPLSVLAGTCQDGTVWTISGSNLVVEVIGSRATIYPPLPNGQPDRGAFSLTLEVTMVVERVRDTQAPNTCTAPLNSFKDASITPLSPTYGSDTCGEIVRYANLTDYDCTGRFFTAHPSTGVDVDTVELRMSHPSDDFVFVALFEVPNVNATKTTYQDTTYTNGTVYSSEYRANFLKISWDITGWRWNKTHPIGTFLSAYTQLTYRVPPGIVNIYQDPRWTNIRWSTNDGTRGTSFEIETAYVVDNIPYVRSAGSTSSSVDIPFTEDTTISFVSGMRICESNIYWANASIDPFLGIFGVTTSAPSSKGTPAYVIVLPVVFGIVILVVAAIVIAVIVSPRVRQFFRPFSKDRENSSTKMLQLDRSDDGESPRAGPSWTKSATPTPH